MIDFVQFLRPDGRRREVSTTRPPMIERMAQRIVELGGRFEVEELQTGEASLTIEGTDTEGEDVTWAIEVVPNGPEVPLAVDRMVEKVYKELTGVPEGY